MYKGVCYCCCTALSPQHLSVMFLAIDHMLEVHGNYILHSPLEPSISTITMQRKCLIVDVFCSVLSVEGLFWSIPLSLPQALISSVPSKDAFHTKKMTGRPLYRAELRYSGPSCSGIVVAQDCVCKGSKWVS
jgi:hypothetical protein